MNHFDQLHRYLFDNTSVRGELVQLSDSYAQILKSQNYPQAIESLLGELMVATSLLTATLKFEGEITVQLQSEGQVKFAAINGDHQQKLRGVARWEGEISDSATLAEMTEKGILIITITPKQGERYQGVVALEGETLAHSIENYFQQSEQLNTRLWLFCGEIDGSPRAGGLLLQQLPAEKPTQELEEEFNLLSQLTQTTTKEEILNLEAKELLYRLYHEQQVRLFEPQPITFFCGCSKERCGQALKTLDKKELEEMLEEHGEIAMHCDYCGASYHFTAEHIEALFNQPTLH